MQAESRAAVPAGVQQEQLEAEERRRSVVLFLFGCDFCVLAGGLQSGARGRVLRVVGV